MSSLYDRDDFWATRFLEEAKRLLNKTNFEFMEKKVHSSLNLQRKEEGVTPSWTPGLTQENYCVLTSGNQSR